MSGRSTPDLSYISSYSPASVRLVSSLFKIHLRIFTLADRTSGVADTFLMEKECLEVCLLLSSHCAQLTIFSVLLRCISQELPCLRSLVRGLALGKSENEQGAQRAV